MLIDDTVVTTLLLPLEYLLRNALKNTTWQTDRVKTGFMSCVSCWRYTSMCNALQVALMNLYPYNKCLALSYGASGDTTCPGVKVVG